MPSPELIIFDCDGVLVDSEPLANKVMAGYLNDVGLTITAKQTAERFLGISMQSMKKIIRHEDGLTLPEDFEGEVLRRDKIAFKTGLKAIDGIFEAIKTLKIPYCLASSGGHGKINNSLTLTGLIKHFNGNIYSADDVENGKPSPDLFLHAADQMDAAPSGTIVIEDSVAGVMAGVAANMRVFGFLGGGHISTGHAGRLIDAGAERVFDHMRELSGMVVN